MTVLALNTALMPSQMVLLHEDHIFSKTISEPRSQTAQLLPLIDELLKEAGVPLSGVDYFALANGPGSFVGLRLGFSCLQSLAYVLKKPVACFSSLQLMAQAAHRETGETHIAVCLNAFMDEVYTGDYVLQKNIMQAKTPDAIMKPDDFNSDAPFLAGEGGYDVHVLPEDLLKLAGVAPQFVADDIPLHYLRDESAWQKR